MRSRRPRRMGGVRPRAAHAAAGEIVHAERVWEEPAGGGAVVARQLALLAGRCELFTALGDDALGRESATRLAELGIDVHVTVGRRDTARVDARRRGRRAHDHRARRQAAAGRPASSRRLRPRLLRRRRPRGASLGARRALPRRHGARAADAEDGDVELDLLVASANDPGERYDGSLRVRHVAVTDGANGGTLDGEPYAAAPTGADRRHVRRRRLVRRGARVRAGPRRRRAPRAELAARAGAAVIAGAGPYEAQLAFPA